MKSVYILLILLFVVPFYSNAQGYDGNKFHRANNLIWGQIDKNFYNGAFIGDGVQGAMIMQDDKDPNAVRMLMGHYQAIAHQSISGWEYANSRVYAGNIMINPVGKANKQTMLLDIFNGKASGEIGTNEGSIKWSVISDRDNLVFAVKIETTGNEGNANLGIREEWGISPRFYLDKKDPYTFASQLPPLPVKEKSGDIDLVVNKMRLRGAHVVASKLIEVNTTTKLLYVAIGVSDNNSTDVAANIAKADAIARVNAAVAEGYETIHARHTNWWNNYMNKGTLAIKEDPYWQKFWWLQIYKFGCASSETSSYLIDTQGPWIWETAWAGVWWNLNIQLSYFPVFSSNRLDAGKSLINGMNRLYNSGALRANAGNTGIYIGRSSSYEGKATWGDELGNLPWILHCYYKYWKYSGDDAIGHSLFPMLKDNMKFLSSKMSKGADGKYHVSAGRSPEYDDQKLYVDANYSLMSIDWLLRALLEMNVVLSMNDSESTLWQDRLDNLVPLPENSNGYMVAPTQGFDKGHRHYSHLLSIYPYHTISIDEDPTNLIGRSVDRWLTLSEASGNAGYTYTGGCAMRAIQGNGDEALRLLEKLRTDKLHPNTMYSEGGGPVIETPLSGVESINYLVLQSHGGVIKVFPAVPSKWKNVSFDNFRTEGAFLVSASLIEGDFSSFEIVSEKGNTCRLRNPWTGHSIKVVDGAGQAITLAKEKNDYSFQTEVGEKYSVERINNPKIIGAKVENSANEMLVEFSDELSIEGAINGFSLKDGDGNNVSFNSIVLQTGGKILKFGLQSAISNTAKLSLSYANGNIKSVYGLNLANFTGLQVDILLQGAPPVLKSAYVEGDSLFLNFNKELKEGLISGFVLTLLPGTGINVKELIFDSVMQDKIKLVLDVEIFRGQELELSYSGTSVSSKDGGVLQSISAFRIDNRSMGKPPVVLAATAQINGIDIRVDFDKNMSEVAQEILYFVIKADGLSIPVSMTKVEGKTVTLSASKLLKSGQTITLSYLEGGNVVSIDGGKLTYFADLPVVNEVVSKYIIEFKANSSFPNFEIDIAEKAKVVYNDRGFVFPELPDSINKVEFIRWSNNMKSHNLEVIASFKTLEDGRVYIAHDNRLQKPNWLKNEYMVTNFQFNINDALMTLYYKEVKNNTLVQLGSNQIPGTETGSSTNYVAFFRKGAITANSSEVFFNHSLYIYPNPADDFIHLMYDNETPGKVELFALSGMLVFQASITAGLNLIPVSHLREGMYFMRLMAGRNVGTKKIIIAH